MTLPHDSGSTSMVFYNFAVWKGSRGRPKSCCLFFRKCSGLKQTGLICLCNSGSGFLLKLIDKRYQNVHQKHAFCSFYKKKKKNYSKHVHHFCSQIMHPSNCGSTLINLLKTLQCHFKGKKGGVIANGYPCFFLFFAVEFWFLNFLGSIQ